MSRSARQPDAPDLHTAAYWLLHTLRAATPKRSMWARAEFNTLRLRLIKIAARVVEGARVSASGCQRHARRRDVRVARRRFAAAEP